jgi:hypothetical protein
MQQTKAQKAFREYIKTQLAQKDSQMATVYHVAAEQIGEKILTGNQPTLEEILKEFATEPH